MDNHIMFISIQITHLSNVIIYWIIGWALGPRPQKGKRAKGNREGRGRRRGNERTKAIEKQRKTQAAHIFARFLITHLRHLPITSHLAWPAGTLVRIPMGSRGRSFATSPNCTRSRVLAWW